jgi:phenylalanine-4-hydroxylase
MQSVEFGLIRTRPGSRIFSAGIMSSATESVFALADDTPHRIAFEMGHAHQMFDR